MRKYWKILLPVLILIIIIALYFVFFHEWTPEHPDDQPLTELSQSQMDMIDDEFTAKWAMWKDQKILWDRNVDGAKTYACQYVGTYGDCVAFLQYIHNTTGATWEPISLPNWLEYEFFQRRVYLHNNAYLLLYNLKEQKFRPADSFVDRDIQWLTDEQKEQLAQGIEAISKNPLGYAQLAPEAKYRVQSVLKESKYEDLPIIWYDENNYHEKENIWRYIGYYGGQLVLLKIGDNKTESGEPLDLPYLLKELSSDVYYPNEAEIFVFYGQLNSTEVSRLADMDDRAQWIPDSELEQLTQDLEKIAQAQPNAIDNKGDGDMRTCWKWIFSVTIVLLAGLLIWLIFTYNPIPRLSKNEKANVEKAFSDQKMESSEGDTIIWYDENGYVEEEHVWRYIGTYGDCYAFLRIGMEETSLPDLLQELSRDVYYPNHADVMLYHTKRTFTYSEVSCGTTSSQERCKLMCLDSIRNRDEWITDEQLEQLTRDIEKLAKAHK